MIGIDRPAVRLRVGAVAAASAVVLSGCTGSSERAATTTPGGSASSTSAVTTSTTTTTSAAGIRSSTVPAQPMRTTTPTRARVLPTPRSTPKPSPKPAPKPPSGTGVTGQFLSLVNSERAKAGCGAVRSNSALQRAAQGHSADMAAKNYFSHTSKDGRTFADRIRAAGYGGGTIGENIAAGQSTASAVMRSWLASSGHRANILNCAFTAMGVGYAKGGSYGHYWTQDFGG